jgi:hypothetical protein
LQVSPLSVPPKALDAVARYHGHRGRAAELDANGHDLEDPQLSPIYGDFTRFGRRRELTIGRRG